MEQQDVFSLTTCLLHESGTVVRCMPDRKTDDVECVSAAILLHGDYIIVYVIYECRDPSEGVVMPKDVIRAVSVKGEVKMSKRKQDSTGLPDCCCRDDLARRISGRHRKGRSNSRPRGAPRTGSPVRRQ